MGSGSSKFASSLLAAVALGAGVAVVVRRLPAAPQADYGGITAVLNEGDMVFRRGDGLWSGLFADASPHDRRFSHVGVTHRSATGGWMVTHASASDLTGIGRVASEPLERFLAEAVAWEIRRPALERTALPGFLEFLHHAEAEHLPFDTDFAIDDDQRVYCTELIWRAWISATGADPVPEKTLWRASLRIVCIEDLIRLSAPIELGH